jgi:hypothetical protein
MVVYLSPLAGAGWQFFTNAGAVLSGGLLYTYSAGTVTPLSTYTSSTGLIANSNPIVLDSAGRTSSDVWLTSNLSYKFVLKTSAGVTIGTYDNISGINDIGNIPSSITMTFGETMVAGNLARSLSGQAAKASNTTAAGITNFIGIVTVGATVGNQGVISTFSYSNYSLLTASAPVYIGAAGALTQTKPTGQLSYPKCIGYATSTTTVLLSANGEADTTFSSINVANNLSGTPIQQGLINQYRSITANYDTTFDDYNIMCSGSAFTVTLTAGSGRKGQTLKITKTDASLSNIITINPAASDTINGVATTTLNTQYESITCVYDGVSNWVITTREIPSSWTQAAITFSATTSAPSKGTVLVDKFWWRRVGTDITFRLEYSQSVAGSAGTGDYLISMPTGLSIDTSALTVNTTVGAANSQFSIGNGMIRNDTTDSEIGICIPYGSSSFRIGFTIASVGGSRIFSSSQYPLSTANMSLAFTGTIPISGWNS